MRYKIEEDLRKRFAGYKGEQQLDYHLESLTHNKNVRVFHDLRLPLRDYYFQIDTLLLTPFCILIIEVKSIAGTVTFFNEFNQYTRKINNQEEGFSNPLSQAKRHQRQLRDWLTMYNIPSLPIDYLVVISNPSTIIRTTNPNKRELSKVIHLEDVMSKIIEVTSNKKELVSQKIMNKMTKQLLKSNVQYKPSPEKTYNISTHDIVTGVQCPECLLIPMIRMRGKWKCSTCSTYSKDAHIRALEDYYYLVSPEITKKKLRSYLHLHSRRTAVDILSSLKIESEGDNRGRIYYLAPKLIQ